MNSGEPPLPTNGAGHCETGGEGGRNSGGVAQGQRPGWGDVSPPSWLLPGWKGNTVYFTEMGRARRGTLGERTGVVSPMSRAPRLSLLAAYM